MSNRDKIYIALSLTGILGVLLFVLGNDLVWDDIFFIEAYSNLGEPSQLVDSLTEPFWQNSAYSSQQLTSFWRPLTSLFLALAALVFGKWPAAYHGLSLVCLLGASFTLFRLLSRLLPEQHRQVVAFTAAAIFVIHPLSTEVLCMAANISDHLALTFLLGATWFYLDYFEDTGGNRRLVLAALFGFLALASKEIGVVFILLPVIAFLLERSVGVDIAARQLLSVRLWTSVFVPTIVFFTLRSMVMYHSGASDNFLNKLGDISLVAAVLGVGQALVRTCLPIPQGAHAYILTTDPVAWLAVVVHLALILVLALRFRKGSVASLIPIGMFLGLLLTLPSFIMIDEYDIGFRFPTRYFHLYLAGLMISLAPILQAKWNAGFRFAIPVIIVLFALLSWMRIDEWKNEHSLAYAEAEYHPNSAYELLNLTASLLTTRHYDKAEATLDRIVTTPDSEDPYFLSIVFGFRSEIALLRDGDLSSATRLAEKALAIKPDHLGHVFRLATMRTMDNRQDQSMTILRKALAATWFTSSQKEEIKRRMEHLNERGKE